MLIEAERAVVSVWCARLTWALLPVSDRCRARRRARADGRPARRALAAVLLWAAWTLGLVALLAPRPWGLTSLRVVAPAAVVVALLAIGSTSAASATLAVTSVVVAAAFALSAPVAQAAGNALAYGDEIRFPLRIPLALFFGPVPLAVALIAAGASVGPLLLAERELHRGHHRVGGRHRLGLRARAFVALALGPLVGARAGRLGRGRPARARRSRAHAARADPRGRT